MSRNWQDKYENGFHVKSFYNSSNIYVSEPRFLSNIMKHYDNKYNIFAYLIRIPENGKSDKFAFVKNPHA